MTKSPTSSKNSQRIPRILYADCFTLASAIEHKATIVTGDPEFLKVELIVSIIRV